MGMERAVLELGVLPKGTYTIVMWTSGVRMRACQGDPDSTPAVLTVHTDMNGNFSPKAVKPNIDLAEGCWEAIMAKYGKKTKDTNDFEMWTSIMMVLGGLRFFFFFFSTMRILTST